jgi:hypothetical protein
MKTALEFAIKDFLDHIVNGIVDALDHRRKNETGLDHILVRVDADDEFVRLASLVSAILLDRIERTETGVAGGGKDDVSTFFDLA